MGKDNKIAFVRAKNFSNRQRTQQGLFMWFPDKELKGIARKFAEQPDPLPCRDEDGNIVRLTDEEQTRWDNFMSRKQGKRMVIGNTENQAAQSVAQIKEEDLPF